MHVSIGRNPELGCDIQDGVCGKYWIMLSISLAKTSVEKEANSINEDEDGVLHETKILLNIVSMWVFINRVVCSDSYFVYVTASEALKYIFIRFIGIVKTNIKNYCNTFLILNFRTEEIDQD